MSQTPIDIVTNAFLDNDFSYITKDKTHRKLKKKSNENIGFEVNNSQS